MNEQELEPCPFCGGEAEFINYVGNAYRQHRAICVNRCNHGTKPFDKKEDAALAWNTRHDTQEVEQLRQELEERKRYDAYDIKHLFNKLEKIGRERDELKHDIDKLQFTASELATNNELLREELKKHDTYMFMGVPRENETVTALLGQTPAQSFERSEKESEASLKQYHDSVVEKCAREADNWDRHAAIGVRGLKMGEDE